MKRFTESRLLKWAALCFVLCLCFVPVGKLAVARDDDQDVPHYKVDISWPKQLPNNWIYGAIGGMYVDKEDHIWVTQRQGTIGTTGTGLGGRGAARHATCCIPAPPVLEFDTEGNLLKSWGGHSPDYDWPSNEHGILVEPNGDVWIGGSGAPMDRQVLKFTNDGKFLMEIGHPSNAPIDSLNTKLLGYPAGMALDDQAHELYIADGYGNRRVIVYDSNTGAFKRMWGAYGNKPDDKYNAKYDGSGPPKQQFTGPVHCVKIANDGLVYVCDRSGDRIQVFTKDGKFQKEFIIRPQTLGSGTVCDIAFSTDSEQKYLLVDDGTNQEGLVVRRSDGTVLSSFGHNGRQAGQFTALHQLVSDSKGNLYTGEVEDMQRLQKFDIVK